MAHKELTRSLSESPACQEETGLTDVRGESIKSSTSSVSVTPQDPDADQSDFTTDVLCPRSPDSSQLPNEQSLQIDAGNGRDEPVRKSSVTLVIGPLPQPETFSNGIFEVRSSATAGFGAFALRDITRGQTILIEKALFHATYNSLYDELERLETPLLQAFGRMHAHVPKALNGSTDHRVAIFKTNR